jgi:hypothetical protein
VSVLTPSNLPENEAQHFRGRNLLNFAQRDCGAETFAASKYRQVLSPPLSSLSHPPCSLLESIHTEDKLYLVFEHVDKDLKKYMTAVNGHLNPELVLVSLLTSSPTLPLIPPSPSAVLCPPTHGRDQLLPPQRNPPPVCSSPRPPCLFLTSPPPLQRSEATEHSHRSRWETEDCRFWFGEILRPSHPPPHP